MEEQSIKAAIEGLCYSINVGDIFKGVMFFLSELTRLFGGFKITKTISATNSSLLIPPLIKLVSSASDKNCSLVPLNVSSKAANLLLIIFKLVPPNQQNEHQQQIKELLSSISQSIQSLLLENETSQANKSAGIKSILSYISTSLRLSKKLTQISNSPTLSTEEFTKLFETPRKSQFNTNEIREFTIKLLTTSSKLNEPPENSLISIIKRWCIEESSPDFDIICLYYLSKVLRDNPSSVTSSISQNKELIGMIFGRFLSIFELSVEGTSIDKVSNKLLLRSNDSFSLLSFLRNKKKMQGENWFNSIASYYSGKFLASLFINNLNNPQKDVCDDIENRISLLINTLSGWFESGSKSTLFKLTPFISSFIHCISKRQLNTPSQTEIIQRVLVLITESIVVPGLFSGFITNSSSKALFELSTMFPNSICPILLKKAIPSFSYSYSSNPHTSTTARPFSEPSCALKGIVACSRSLFRLINKEENELSISINDLMLIAIQSISVTDLKRTEYAIELLFGVISDVSPSIVGNSPLWINFFDTVLLFARNQSSTKDAENGNNEQTAAQSERKCSESFEVYSLISSCLDTLLLNCDKDTFDSLLSKLERNLLENGSSSGTSKLIGSICNCFVYNSTTEQQKSSTFKRLFTVLYKNNETASLSMENWRFQTLCYFFQRIGPIIPTIIDEMIKIFDYSFAENSDSEISFIGSVFLDQIIQSLTNVFPLYCDNSNRWYNPTEKEINIAWMLIDKYTNPIISRFQQQFNSVDHDSKIDWKQVKNDVLILIAILHGGGNSLFSPISVQIPTDLVNSSTGLANRNSIKITDNFQNSIRGSDFRKRIASLLEQTILMKLPLLLSSKEGITIAMSQAIKQIPRLIDVLLVNKLPIEQLSLQKCYYKQLSRLWKPLKKKTNGFDDKSKSFEKFKRLITQKEYIKRLRIDCYNSNQIRGTSDEVCGRLLKFVASLCYSVDFSSLVRNSALLSLRYTIKYLPEFSFDIAKILISSLRSNDPKQSVDIEGNATNNVCEVLRTCSLFKRKILSRLPLLQQFLQIINEGEINGGPSAQIGIFRFSASLITSLSFSTISHVTSQIPNKTVRNFAENEQNSLVSICDSIVQNVNLSKWRSAIISISFFSSLLPIRLKCTENSPIPSNYFDWLIQGCLSDFQVIRDLSISSLTMLLTNRKLDFISQINSLDLMPILKVLSSMHLKQIHETEEKEESGQSSLMKGPLGKIARQFGGGNQNNSNGSGIFGFAMDLFSRFVSKIAHKWPIQPGPNSPIFSELFADLVFELVEIGGIEVITKLLSNINELLNQALQANENPAGIQILQSEIICGTLRSQRLCNSEEKTETVLSKISEMIFHSIKTSTPTSVLSCNACVRYIARYRKDLRLFLIKTLLSDLETLMKTIESKNNIQTIGRVFEICTELAIECDIEELDLFKGKLVLDALLSDFSVIRRGASHLVSIISHLSHGKDDDINNAIITLCKQVIEDPNIPFNSTVLELVLFATKRRLSEVLQQRQTIYESILSALLSLHSKARDKDISTTAGKLLALMAVITRPRLSNDLKTPLLTIPLVLKSVGNAVLYSNEASKWLSKASALPFLQIVIHNLSSLSINPDESMSVCEMIIKTSNDKQYEVRQASLQAFSSILRCPLIGLWDHIIKTIIPQFGQIINNPQKQTISTEKLMMATVGFSAILLSTPYNVPKHVPQVVDYLLKVSSTEKGIVSNVAHDALQQFKASHLRWWDSIWSQLFTQDQLDSLNEGASSFSSSSYFI